jgi:hypothetical protein
MTFNQLTPWKRVLAKLTVTQLVKVPASCYHICESPLLDLIQSQWNVVYAIMLDVAFRSAIFCWWCLCLCNIELPLYNKHLVLQQEIVSKVHNFSASVIVFIITSECQVGFVTIDVSVQNIQTNIYWMWRQQVPLKCLHSFLTRLCCIASQNTANFIVITVTTSIFTQWFC